MRLLRKILAFIFTNFRALVISVTINSKLDYANVCYCHVSA